MTCNTNIDTGTESKPLLSARVALCLALSAFLAIGTMAATASADDDHGDGGRWGRFHRHWDREDHGWGDWGDGYYPPPAVVYAPPAYYYPPPPPPVVYVPPPAVGIFVPGININIR